MARPLRVSLAGMTYHVLSRGNERNPIFVDDEDKERFIQYLVQMKNRYQVVVYAFVLMDNHYHLLIQTVEPNLSEAVHWLNTSYSVYFNRKNRRVGHLFQGRYKSILIEEKSYLHRVSYYIHLNPLRAGMINRLHEYEWSSYQNYTRIKSTFPFIDSDRILKDLDADNRKARRKYYRTMYGFVDYGSALLSELKHGFILGCDAFTSRIMARVKNNADENDIPQLKMVKNEERLEMILTTIAGLSGLSRSKLCDNPGRNKNPARMAALYLLTHNTSFSYREIGLLFHISGGAVRKSIERMITDPETYQQANSFVESFNCHTNET